MIEYIPPFLLDLVVRAISDPVLQVFCISIFATAVVFFWRTFRDYSKAVRDISSLYLKLEEVIGKRDLPKKHFENFNFEKVVLESDRFEKIFEDVGMDDRGQRLINDMIYNASSGHAIVSYEVIQSIFSTPSLEKSYIANGTSGRSAFLTALGVLGTFAGLVFGVSAASNGLASPDISVARNALSTLLAGAELAFLTSILGLSLALLHGIWLNRHRRALTRHARQLISYLTKVLAARSGMATIGRSNNMIGHRISESNDVLLKIFNKITDVERYTNEISSCLSRNENVSKNIAQDLAEIHMNVKSRPSVEILELLSNIGGELSAIHGNTHHLSKSMEVLRAHLRERTQ
jgi:hypothetical protein